MSTLDPLVGRKVLKEFPGHGWFHGEVTRVENISGKKWCVLRNLIASICAPGSVAWSSGSCCMSRYHVEYDDGDAEHMSAPQLNKVVVPLKGVQEHANAL
jgi:hypothetical protein